MKKKLVSLMLVVSMAGALLAGCGDDSADNDTKVDGTEAGGDDTAEAKGQVYYLNFKPEQDQQWQDLAKAYTEETGVPVNVVTAASGTYEEQLKSEMAKSEAPTLFQVNGPVGLATWKDYCYDFAGSDVYSHLKSDDFALKEGDSVLGIAYVIETYGLIYNKTALEAYCGLENAVVDSVDKINSFDTLKAVADDIQARASEVAEASGFDIQSAFTSAGMDSSSDWRFKTHLANLPIYYEYEADGIGSTEAIKGTYLDNYKAIWDLYVADGPCEGSMLAAKTGDDATAEFGLGNAVFYQNGTWAYGDIINSGVLTDDDLGMMPIYIGVDGEENQGLCTGSENYWCVNKNASEDDIQATLDFLNWVITSDTGRDCVANEMGFATPFDTFDDGYTAANPFLDDANKYIADGKTPVKWCFTTMPSETWKNNVGSALTAYASGTGSWDDVVTAFVDGWATEYQAAHE